MNTTAGNLPPRDREILPFHISRPAARLISIGDARSPIRATLKREGSNSMRSLPDDRPAWTLAHTACLRIWRALRPSLGWLCLALGVLGIIFPLLPGIPFLLAGVALVGRRNWLLRWASIHEKRLLRRWSNHPTPMVRQAGRWLARQQRHVASRLRRRS